MEIHWKSFILGILVGMFIMFFIMICIGLSVAQSQDGDGPCEKAMNTTIVLTSWHPIGDYDT